MDIEFLNGGVPVQIKSLKIGYYLGADNGARGGPVIPAEAVGLNWQTFRLWRINKNKVCFSVPLDQYWGVEDGENGKTLVAKSKKISESEKFEIIRNCDDPKRIRIKAHNGFFLQVKSSIVVTADCNSVSGWKDEDPSVFTMTIMQFKDGAQFRIWSFSFQHFLYPENGGGQKIVADQTKASFWEFFKVGTINERKVSLKASNGLFIGLDRDNNLVAFSNTHGESENFVIVRSQYDPDRIRIKAPNGLFLQVKSRRHVTADFDGDNGWGNDDPSVFMVVVLHNEKDGFRIQLKAVQVGNYLCAENGGGAPITANRTVALSWETFRVCSMNEKRFSFKAFNGQFMGVENSTNKLIAVSKTSGTSETFELVRNQNNSRQVRIKAQNGNFLQVKSTDLVTADYNVANIGWETIDASIFYLTIMSYKEEPEEVRTHYSKKKLQYESPASKGGALNAKCTPSTIEVEEDDPKDIKLFAKLDALLAKPPQSKPEAYISSGEIFPPNPDDFTKSMSTFKSLLSRDLESLLEKHQKNLLLATAATLSKSSELSDKQRSFLFGFPEKLAQLSASLTALLAEKDEASQKIKEREDLGKQLKAKQHEFDVLKQVNEQLKKEIFESLDEFTQLQTRIKVLEDEITQKNKIIQANIAKTKAQQSELTCGMKKLADTFEEVLDWEAARDSAIDGFKKILKEWSSFKDLFP